VTAGDHLDIGDRDGRDSKLMISNNRGIALGATAREVSCLIWQSVPCCDTSN